VALQEWNDLRLDLIEITHRETGEKFKQVWRGIAHRRTEFSPGADDG
jgi:hypothetical protein